MEKTSNRDICYDRNIAVKNYIAMKCEYEICIHESERKSIVNVISDDKRIKLTADLYQTFPSCDWCIKTILGHLYQN